MSFIEFEAIIPNLAPKISQHVAFKESEYITFRVFMHVYFKYYSYKYSNKSRFILNQVYFKHYQGN